MGFKDDDVLGVLCLDSRWVLRMMMFLGFLAWIQVTTDPSNTNPNNNTNDSLHLASSDRPGMVLTNTPFNEGNFLGWSRNVKMALGAKLNLGFIDGSCPKPIITDDNVQRWVMCDYMVTELSEAFLYAQSAYELWKEIAERYGQSNGPLIYQLERELSKITQGYLSIATFFNKLKRCSDELQNLNGLPVCNCGKMQECTCAIYDKFLEKDSHLKLIQFLMKLNDEYEPSNSARREAKKNARIVAHVNSSLEEMISGDTHLSFENDIRMGQNRSMDQRLVDVVCSEMMKIFKGKGIVDDNNGTMRNYASTSAHAGASDHVTLHFSLFITTRYLSNPIMVHLPDGTSLKMTIVGEVALTPSLILYDPLNSPTQPTQLDPNTSFVSSDDQSNSPSGSANVQQTTNPTIPPIPPIASRKSTRNSEKPAWLKDFVTSKSTNANVFAQTEPQSYKQAMTDPGQVEAMNKELEALERNNTWELTTLLAGHKPITSKWVYKIKYNPDATIERLKARLVLRATTKKWDLHQLDINNAFLHGYIDEEIYMVPPEGYTKAAPNQVCKLTRSLYGPKQASRQWKQELTKFLLTYGYVQSKHDYSLFVKSNKDQYTAALVYVDDMLITGNCTAEILSLKAALHNKFTIKDLGLAKYFLGIEICRTSAVQHLSEFVSSPKDTHMQAALHFLNRTSKPNVTGPNTNANSNKARVPVTYAAISKGSSDVPDTSNVPVLVLDDSCVIDRNLILHVIGGYWILMELDSELAKTRLLNNTGVASWFEELKNMTNEFISTDRIVWVDIEGIPMKAWTKESFAKIATKWGIFKKEPTSEYYSDDESVQGDGKHADCLKHDDQNKEKVTISDNFMEIYGRDGECIIMGDFNVVRTESERLGSVFDMVAAQAFNNFISCAGLRELTLDGYSFTWAHKFGSKMSKLDRFLISEDMVKREWIPMEIPKTNNLIKFKLKLQQLKKAIRTWNQNRNKRINVEIIKVKTKLGEIDKILDHGHGSSEVLKCRLELMNDLDEKKKLENMDNAQKVKVKWSIERDENSKFFHGIINKKRTTQDIRGMMVNGEWVIDPHRVKEEFRKHSNHQFLKPPDSRCILNFPFPKKLNAKQRDFLDGWVSREEIRKVVWDCRVNKSPGPDGFTFEFFPLIPKVQDAKFCSDYRPITLIGNMYKVISKFLANRIAGVISELVSDVQSAFVAQRQILDGHFILNEILAWCKKLKKQAMIFKVDFAMAYDSIRWDFLDDTLHSFGFDLKWRRWVKGCLSSAMASILVNGSPSSEFAFERCLKQGDPLSPYLFILVMESSNLSFNTVVVDGLYSGITIGTSMKVSHLFYADDVVFVRDWSQINIQSLGLVFIPKRLCKLRIFIGCLVLKLSFKYLGVMIGNSLSRKLSWAPIIQKIQSRLSKWKAKTLSIGGRFTLLKSVLGASPIYSMSIYKVPTDILDLMESIRNKFFNGAVGKESKLLGDRDYGSLQKAYSYGKMAADLEGSFRRRVRSGVEGDQLTNMRDNLDSCSLSSQVDMWYWDLNGEGEFMVKDVRNLLDEAVLPHAVDPTRWVKGVSMEYNFCSVCDEDIENTSHIIFKCEMASIVHQKICKWWQIDFYHVSSYAEWLSWFKNIRLPSKKKLMLEGVFYISWWQIWNFMNQILFGSSIPRRSTVFDDIVSRSFMYVSSKCKKNFSLTDLMSNPSAIAL
nr:putative RNA-directed DNA polymerase, eukaryota, reverse transcriptase zinc-binding domain protein [Tanacetum cinerariifolium]